jgi:hypothetical protein
MEAQTPTPSPFDQLPGRFPLREDAVDDRMRSGHVSQSCRITDPFAAFPQRGYHLSRLMYARKIERMLQRAEAIRIAEERARNPVLTVWQGALRRLRSTLNPSATA